MSDIDRIFPRLGSPRAAAMTRREVLSVPRGRVGGSRVVEVVRVRSGNALTGAAPPGRDDARVRAAAWDEGLPVAGRARAAAPPEPEAGPSTRPVVHVMPAWEPGRLRPQRSRRR